MTIIIIMDIFKCSFVKLLCNKSCGETFNVGQKHDTLIRRKNQNIVGNNNNNNNTTSNDNDNDDDDDDDDDNNNNNNNNRRRRRRTLYQCLITYQFIQN